VTTFNGTKLEAGEKRDCEIFYMKETYRDFLKYLA